MLNEWRGLDVNLAEQERPKAWKGRLAGLCVETHKHEKKDNV